MEGTEGGEEILSWETAFEIFIKNVVEMTVFLLLHTEKSIIVNLKEIWHQDGPIMSKEEGEEAFLL